MNIQDWVSQKLGSFGKALRGLESGLNQLKGRQDAVESIVSGSQSIVDEINTIPGRRVPYFLNGNVTFDISDDGRRGEPVNLLVSQDGPFIQTHQPIISWRPSAPDNATAFGLWRPVIAGYPLPDQAAAAGQDFDTDLLAISWELIDAGSQRNFQNLPTQAGGLSYPMQLVPTPIPVLYTPNTTIQCFPTYQRILFNNTAVPPTEGTLEVSLPGYRIVNL